MAFAEPLLPSAGSQKHKFCEVALLFAGIFCAGLIAGGLVFRKDFLPKSEATQQDNAPPAGIYSKQQMYDSEPPQNQNLESFESPLVHLLQQEMLVLGFFVGITAILCLLALLQSLCCPKCEDACCPNYR